MSIVRFLSPFQGRTGLDRRLLLLLLCPLSTGVVAAPADGPHPIELREGLSLKRTGSRGRSTVFTDPVEALLVAGKWKIPAAGETMVKPDGSTLAWEKTTANQDGWFVGDGARGGHIVIPYVADRPGVWVLEAAGHNMVYVNGEPRAGDVYGYGFARMPISLRAGTNDLLFVGGRGRLRARLVRPRAARQFNPDDATLPDLVVGERADTWGAVIVLNASLEPSASLEIVATLSGQSNRTPVPPLPPLSMRKVGFRLAGPAPSEAGTAPLILELKEGESGSEGGLGLDRIELKVRTRRPEQSRKITFRSEIDGSIQYYAANPGQCPPGGPSQPALFLTLHGAGVEAIGQADAYAPKKWGVLVAPTNRRPYGFDWEEWGRMDALEVLALARKRFQPDPSLVYLTGHSMGGHGVWNVGVNFPDLFAAIGPSAGWISFWSYGGSRRGQEPDPVEGMLLRGMANSDTLGLLTNCLNYGVYILHGEADDNVPVKEARIMRDHLSEFDHDYDWHEEPKAGHWWDNSDEPGAACVDWPPLFDFFARHRRPDPATVRQVNFTTMNPGVSAISRWAAILQQVHPLIPSHIDLQWDPGRLRFRGTTENVAALSLEVPPVPEASALIAELDGQSITNQLEAATERVWLVRREGAWRFGAAPPPSEKGPLRSGPFKEAFQHRMVFVYGTHGTPEENAWSLAKARFDAETFWYRGNGSVDLLADNDFVPAKFPDRGVVVYGNRDANGVWAILLGSSPVQVGRKSVTVGERRLEGDDLAVLFIRPRPDSDVATVAVVAGTGLEGMRLTNRLPYFISGNGYPDCLVLQSSVLEKGNEGILGAGFFGNDWSVEKGEFAWRK